MGLTKSFFPNKRDTLIFLSVNGFHHWLSVLHRHFFKNPKTGFILLFVWICHWQRLVICCPQCTNTSLDSHWSDSVTWLNSKLLIGQRGFVGSFLYNWSKSNFIKNNNIEFNCLYFSYLVDRKWCQPSVLFCPVSCWIIFHSFFSFKMD